MIPNDGRVVSNFICQLKGIPDYLWRWITTSHFVMLMTLFWMMKLMYSDYVSPINIGNPIELL